tara:strand:+ start:1582 stop:2304 length:723 start_codon:yes stop_codon:yes gene_type:complete
LEKTTLIKKILFPIFFNFIFGESLHLNVGETLLYSASFRNIYVANANLKILRKEVIGSDSVYHVRFTAKSEGPINYIFPIDDEINLWLDAKTLLPVKIDEKISEGNLKRSTKIHFNRKNNFALINNDTLSIKKNTQSPYSLFYFFRKNSIQDFKNREISLIQNKKTVLLDLTVRENEVVNVPAGEYTCSVVSPKRKNNKKFKNKGELDVMFSNDQKKYPVKIRLKLKYGYLILELDKIIN